MSRYKKVEYKIKANNLFNTSNPYDCWVLSYCMALQDLLKTNQLLLDELSKETISKNSFFYHKLTLGFLKEAWDIITSSLKSDVAWKIRKVKDFDDIYLKITNILDDRENIDIKKFIEISRNCIFHYKNILKRKNDRKVIHKAVNNLSAGNYRLTYRFSFESNTLHDLQGAEDIQMNMILQMPDPDDNIQLEKVIGKTAALVAQVINLLQTVVFDFLAHVPEHKRNLTKYR